MASILMEDEIYLLIKYKHRFYLCQAPLKSRKFVSTMNNLI